MRLLRSCLLLCAFLASCAGPSSLAFHAGQRDYAIADDLPRGLADPFSLGADLVLGVLPYGLGLEASVIRSAERASETAMTDVFSNEIETLEAALGLRKTFPLGSGAEVYLGAGVSYIDAEFDFEDGSSGSFEDSDGAPGGYGKIGFAWPMGTLRAGLEYRRTFGSEATIAGNEIDLDYQLYTISIGIGF